jgi:uncharacterized protein
MRPSIALDTHREAIRRIVSERHARNPRVFGSVLHGKDREDSDLDLLVDSTSDTSLLDLAGIELELERLLGVRVQVITAGSLPESFRGSVIAEARPV